MFKKFLKSKLQQGQALIFFAASLPVICLFVGAAMDFGWMYLNQSRLQNAADSAVVAGAKQLIVHDSNLDDYLESTLISSNDADFLRLVNENVVSSRSTSDGDRVAMRYAEANLTWLNEKKLNLVDVSSNPNDSDHNEWGTVKFQHILYGSDAEDYQTLYYVVTLSEKLDHLFGTIMDYFGIEPMYSKAMAVAKITHYHSRRKDDNDPVHGESLYVQMRALEKRKNFSNWWKIYYEYQTRVNNAKNDAEEKQALEEKYDTSSDLWVIARKRSVQAKGNEYVDGNFYRTETLMLDGFSIVSDNGKPKGNEMDQRDFDNLFVDLKVDASSSSLRDADKGSSQTNYNLKENSSTSIKKDTVFASGLTGEQVWKFRIHDLINVGLWNGSSYSYAYKVREGKEAPDPLYIYIENEDNYVDGNNGNSVRQFIINVNASNTDEANDRPMFFFYDGPQKYYGSNKNGNNQTVWNEKWRETWRHLGYNDDEYFYNPRNSLPVILNLYADFRGVLFMPNSPVVVNGNGHTLEGFIVAEKFLRLKNATDFPEVAQSPPQDFLYSNPNSTEDWYTDGRGNQYYRNRDGIVYYNKKAEGGTRYIQVVTEGNVTKYLNVIYAKGTFTPATKNPQNDIVTKADNIYLKPDGSYVVIEPNDSRILYTYTLIEQEKSNIFTTATLPVREKAYVTVNPMYIDEFGNVQYMPLESSYRYDARPNPLDTAWHSNYNYQSSNYDANDDTHEVIYRPEMFGLAMFGANNSVTAYNAYNNVVLNDYTNLNDSNRNINDMFYTTVRSTWID